MNLTNPSDGAIKFQCHRENQELFIPEEISKELIYWRDRLYGMGLIGLYPNGIGFGNISVRTPGDDRFFISGSATGGLPELTSQHLVLVEQCDSEKNQVWCRGLIDASSETMSHAAIYQNLQEVKGVIHIHSVKLWEAFFGKLPTTSPSIEYGTPEMALEIGRTIQSARLTSKGILVMGGHPEGLIAFGTSLEEAANEIFQLYL